MNTQPVSGIANLNQTSKGSRMKPETVKFIARVGVSFAWALSLVGFCAALLFGSNACDTALKEMNAKAQKEHQDQEVRTAQTFLSYCKPVRGEAECRLEVLEKFHLELQ